VERYNSPELMKSKVQTEERCYSPEVVKPKIQTVEKCNLPEMMKRNISEIQVSAFTGKENKEMSSLNKSQTDQQPEAEKKITVLKRGSDEKLSPTITNKHGPVGSGRDRKNDEKVTKCESSLVLVETIKKESESNLLLMDSMVVRSTSNYDDLNDIKTFSTNDSGYNLWTSYVWEPITGLSTKSPSP